MVLARDLKSNSRIAYKCLDVTQCPSTTLSLDRDSCPVGASGIACATCDRGYFYSKSTRRCLLCGSEWATGSVIFLFLFLYLIFIAWLWIVSSSSHATHSTESIHLRVVGLRFTSSISLLIGNIQNFWVLGLVDEMRLTNLSDNSDDIGFTDTNLLSGLM